MKQFIKFQAKYFGETNSIDVIEVLNPEKALDYIKSQNNLYKDCMWFFPVYTVLTPDEALKYVIAFIKSEQDYNLEDSEEHINNLLTQLEECYNIKYTLS